MTGMTLIARRLIAACLLAVVATGGASAYKSGSTNRYYATWLASPNDADEPSLSRTRVAPPTGTLEDQTLRQIAHISIGGSQLRIKFSNLYGSTPLALERARVAVSKDGEAAIDPATDTAITFSARPGVIIPAGSEVWSDPVNLTVRSLSNLAVSTYLKTKASLRSAHRSAMRSNYLAAGDTTSAAQMPMDSRVGSYHWITEIAVARPRAPKVVVAFGDSITDGTGSGAGKNTRYPDQLSARAILANTRSRDVSIVNAGIGGNRWLHDGLALRGTERFIRDVLGTSGVTHTIVLLGVNDLGFAALPDSPLAAPVTAQEMTAALAGAVRAAHRKRVKIFLGTILPYKGAFYFTEQGERTRQAVNDWIRKSSRADGVIDFDEVMRDPQNPQTILAPYHSGDHLHPSEAGYKKMAETIDLAKLR